MAAFDYKKEYKEFYLPPKKPQIIEIPAMNFLAVRGQGNPMKNEVLIRTRLACFTVWHIRSK